MGYCHSWDKVVGGNVCKYCETLRIKMYHMYQSSFVYVDKDRNISSRAGDCKVRTKIEAEKKKEEEMRLLEIIDKARERKMMPVLADGVYLKIKENEIIAVNKFESKRCLFKMEDGELLISSFIKRRRQINLLETKDDYYQGFFELGERTIKKDIQVKVGSKPETFEEDIIYIDVKGKTKTIREQRTKIVPVYKNIVEESVITTIKFEGDK